MPRKPTGSYIEPLPHVGLRCYGDERRDAFEAAGKIGAPPSSGNDHDGHLIERWADRKIRLARERAGIVAPPKIECGSPEWEARRRQNERARSARRRAARQAAAGARAAKPAPRRVSTRPQPPRAKALRGLPQGQHAAKRAADRARPKAAAGRAKRWRA